MGGLVPLSGNERIDIFVYHRSVTVRKNFSLSILSYFQSMYKINRIKDEAKNPFLRFHIKVKYSTLFFSLI